MKYSCTRINFNKILLLIAIALSTQAVCAYTTRSSKNTEYLTKNINSIFLTPYYTAYIETGGFKFLGTSSHLKGAIDADLFIPLWQRKNELLFTDIRGVRQTNYIYEGNIHVGYRRLYPEYKTIFGIYGAFDRKKTEYGNYYNQLMLGGEYWIKRLFLGANVYYPIGTTEKRKEQITDRPERGSYRSVWYNASYEKAMPGVDAEIGYELADGLIAYAGGYYFKTNDVKAITGPQFKIEKIFYARQKSRFLGVIDALTLEGGIKYDKERGKRITLGVKLRLGPPFQGAPNLKSFERHMMDPVRRDIDIVSTELREKNIADRLIGGYKEYTETPRTGYDLEELIDEANGVFAFNKEENNSVPVYIAVNSLDPKDPVIDSGLYDESKGVKNNGQATTKKVTPIFTANNTITFAHGNGTQSITFNKQPSKIEINRLLVDALKDRAKFEGFKQIGIDGDVKREAKIRAVDGSKNHKFQGEVSDKYAEEIELKLEAIEGLNLRAAKEKLNDPKSEIYKKAYNATALKVHPDKNLDNVQAANKNMNDLNFTHCLFASDSTICKRIPKNIKGENSQAQNANSTPKHEYKSEYKPQEAPPKTASQQWGECRVQGTSAWNDKPADQNQKNPSYTQVTPVGIKIGDLLPQSTATVEPVAIKIGDLLPQSTATVEPVDTKYGNSSVPPRADNLSLQLTKSGTENKTTEQLQSIVGPLTRSVANSTSNKKSEFEKRRGDYLDKLIKRYEKAQQFSGLVLEELGKFNSLLSEVAQQGRGITNINNITYGDTYETFNVTINIYRDDASRNSTSTSSPTASLYEPVAIKIGAENLPTQPIQEIADSVYIMTGDYFGTQKLGNLSPMLAQETSNFFGIKIGTESLLPQLMQEAANPVAIKVGSLPPQSTQKTSDSFDIRTDNFIVTPVQEKSNSVAIKSNNFTDVLQNIPSVNKSNSFDIKIGAENLPPQPVQKTSDSFAIKTGNFTVTPIPERPKSVVIKVGNLLSQPQCVDADEPEPIGNEICLLPRGNNTYTTSLNVSNSQSWWQLLQVPVVCITSGIAVLTTMKYWDNIVQKAHDLYQWIGVIKNTFFSGKDTTSRLPRLPIMKPGDDDSSDNSPPPSPARGSNLQVFDISGLNAAISSTAIVETPPILTKYVQRLGFYLGNLGRYYIGKFLKPTIAECVDASLRKIFSTKENLYKPASIEPTTKTVIKNTLTGIETNHSKRAFETIKEAIRNNVILMISETLTQEQEQEIESITNERINQLKRLYLSDYNVNVATTTTTVFLPPPIMAEPSLPPVATAAIPEPSPSAETAPAPKAVAETVSSPLSPMPMSPAQDPEPLPELEEVTDADEFENIAMIDRMLGEDERVAPTAVPITTTATTVATTATPITEIPTVVAVTTTRLLVENFVMRIRNHLFPTTTVQRALTSKQNSFLKHVRDGLNGLDFEELTALTLDMERRNNLLEQLANLFQTSDQTDIDNKIKEILLKSRRQPSAAATSSSSVSGNAALASPRLRSKRIQGDREARLKGLEDELQEINNPRTPVPATPTPDSQEIVSPITIERDMQRARAEELKKEIGELKGDQNKQGTNTLTHIPSVAGEPIEDIIRRIRSLLPPAGGDEEKMLEAANSATNASEEAMRKAVGIDKAKTGMNGIAQQARETVSDIGRTLSELGYAELLIKSRQITLKSTAEALAATARRARDEAEKAVEHAEKVKAGARKAAQSRAAEKTTEAAEAVRAADTALVNLIRISALLKEIQNLRRIMQNSYDYLSIDNKDQNHKKDDDDSSAASSSSASSTLSISHGMRSSNAGSSSSSSSSGGGSSSSSSSSSSFSKELEHQEKVKAAFQEFDAIRKQKQQQQEELFRSSSSSENLPSARPSHVSPRALRRGLQDFDAQRVTHRGPLTPEQRRFVEAREKVKEDEKQRVANRFRSAATTSPTSLKDIQTRSMASLQDWVSTSLSLRQRSVPSSLTSSSSSSSSSSSVPLSSSSNPLLAATTTPVPVLPIATPMPTELELQAQQVVGVLNDLDRYLFQFLYEEKPRKEVIDRITEIRNELHTILRMIEELVHKFRSSVLELQKSLKEKLQLYGEKLLSLKQRIVIVSSVQVVPMARHEPHTGAVTDGRRGRLLNNWANTWKPLPVNLKQVAEKKKRTRSVIPKKISTKPDMPRRPESTLPKNNNIVVAQVYNQVKGKGKKGWNRKKSPANVLVTTVAPAGTIVMHNDGGNERSPTQIAAAQAAADDDDVYQAAIKALKDSSKGLAPPSSSSNS